MHEDSFATLACPARHVVLSLTLLEFRIGHRLVLLRDQNPLIWLSEAHFNQLPLEEQSAALIEAVYVCAKTFAERKRLETPCFLNWRQRLNKWDVRNWHRTRKRAEEKDVAALKRESVQRFTEHEARVSFWSMSVTDFRNYLAASRPITEWEDRREGFPFMPCLPTEREKSRDLGGPFDATLIQFLLSSGLCRTEAECMEYPFGLAETHYLTHLEHEGALKIVNAKEMQFESDCQANDLAAAKAAGYNTIAEHIAAIKRGQKSENSGQNPAGLTSDLRSPTSAPPAGLATAVPEELLQPEISGQKSAISPTSDLRPPTSPP